MKKLLVSMLGCALCAFTFGDVSYVNGFGNDGSGEVYEEPSQIDGVYQIANGGQLFWFANMVNSAAKAEKHAVLTANIDLEGSAHNWPIIGKDGNNYFKGTFDGQGYKISNFHLSGVTGVDYQGFFGRVKGATISSVTVSGTFNFDSTQGTDYSAAGFIASVPEDSTGVTLSEVHCALDIVTRHTQYKKDCIGGLVGYSYKSKLTIDKCRFSGSITGTQQIYKCGGIVGYLRDPGVASISNCLFDGEINASATTNSRFGGILGHSYNSSFAGLFNCLSVGTVAVNGGSGLKNGALVGFGEQGGSRTSSDCNYYTAESVPNAGTSSGSVYDYAGTWTHLPVVATAETLADGTVLAGLNNGADPVNWEQDTALGYPIPFMKKIPVGAAPTVSVQLTEQGFYGLKFRASVLDFGTDASSADLVFTLASDEDFNNVVATLSKTSAQVELDQWYEFEAASLALSTEYYLKVESTNDLGEKFEEESPYVTKAPAGCDVALALEKSGTTIVSLFWDVASIGDLSDYAVISAECDSSDSFGAPYTIVIDDQLAEAPASGRVVFRALSPSTTYYFRLKGLNEFGSLSYSDVIAATTAATDATRTWANTGTDMNDAMSYVEQLAPDAGCTIYFTEPMQTQPNLTAGLTVKGIFFGRYDGARTDAAGDPTGYVFTAEEGAALTLAASGDSQYAINSATTDGCQIRFDLPISLSGSKSQLAANGTQIDLHGDVSTTSEYTQDVYPMSNGADDNHRGMIIFSGANPGFKPKKIHCSLGNIAIGHPDAFKHVPEIVSGNWSSMVPRLYNLTGKPVVLDELLKFSMESYGLNQLNFEGSPFIMSNCVFGVSQRNDKWRVCNAAVTMKTVGGWDYSGSTFTSAGTNMLEVLDPYYEKEGIVSHIEIRQGMFFPHQLLQTVAREGRRCRINGDGCNGSSTPYPTLGVNRDVRIPVSNLGGISFGRDNERKGGGLSAMGGEVSVTLTDTNDVELVLVDNVKTPEGSGYIAPYPWAFGNMSATGTLCLENDIERSGDTDVYTCHGGADVTARLMGDINISGGNFTVRGNGALAIENGITMSSGKYLRASGDAGLLINCDLTEGFDGKVFYNGTGWLGGTGKISQFHFEAANSALRGGEFGHGTLTVDGSGGDFKFATTCGIIVDITDEGTCGLLKFEGDLSKYFAGYSGYWLKIVADKEAPRGKYKIMDWSEGTGTPTKMMTVNAYKDDIRYDETIVKRASLVVEDSAMYLYFTPWTSNTTVIVFR